MSNILSEVREPSPLDLFNGQLRIQLALMRAQFGCQRMQTDPHRDLDLGPVVLKEKEWIFPVAVTGTASVSFNAPTRAAALTKAIAWLKDVSTATRQTVLRMDQGMTFDVGTLEAELDSLTPQSIPDTPEVLARKERVRNYARGRVQNGDISRKQVNPHLEALGIEPLPGPKKFVFEVPVEPAPMATFDITANSEEEALVVLQAKLNHLRGKGTVKSEKMAGWVPVEGAVGRVMSAVDVD